MWILMGTVFVASLLGSLHCVGMCGPFALLAGADERQNRSAIVPTLAYSGGRLITYSIVGLLFGAIGLALNFGASFSHWQQMATWVAGALMVMVGIVSLARYFGLRINLPKVFSPVQKRLGGAFARARQLPPARKAFAIGALTSLMPCGWLYTFAIAAAGTGSPFWGTLLMIAFWGGTVPIMAALMMGADKISRPMQKRLPVIMSALVIGIGLFTMFYRAPVSLAGVRGPITDRTQLIQSVNEIDHESLPCCAQKHSAADTAKEAQ
jgi:sulfite exporter TauE/SafE